MAGVGQRYQVAELAPGPRKDRREREKENRYCRHGAGCGQHQHVQDSDDGRIGRSRQQDKRACQEQDSYAENLGDNKAEDLVASA